MNRNHSMPLFPKKTLGVTWKSTEPFVVRVANAATGQAQPRRGRWQRSAGLVVAALLTGMGCSAPSVARQRLVAKPNMTFSESGVFSYNSSKLLPQLASGFGSSGGPQNSGCTSCR